jgi:hypothetical protein
MEDEPRSVSEAGRASLETSSTTLTYSTLTPLKKMPDFETLVSNLKE